MSGFSKVIPVGEKGQLSISEAAGVATLAFSIAESVGGGSTAGVLVAKATAEVDIKAEELIDAGMGLAKAKWPALAGAIDGIQKFIDDEIAKI